MTRDELISYVLAKLNTRSASMLCAVVLVCGGICMCFADLTSKGSIDLKAAILEGNVETGSLGIMAMFLGVVIVLALNLTRPYSGQEVKLVINGNEITGTGLSYRKMHDLIQAALQATATTAQEDRSVARDDESC